jgi:hypothetical protein
MPLNELRLGFPVDVNGHSGAMRSDRAPIRYER